MREQYSLALVSVGNLARQMQLASADGQRDQVVYELATRIMLECQIIRDYLDGKVE